MDHSCSTRSANCQCILHPRRWKESETSLAVRTAPAPAKFPVQRLHSGYRRPRCKAPRVSPLVRESHHIMLSDAFWVRWSPDNLMGVLHAERQTRLPILRAMEATNHSMKSLSPWRANAAVCAPAFIKVLTLGQSCSLMINST